MIYQQKQQERMNMVEFFSKKHLNSSQTTNLSQKQHSLAFENQSLTNNSKDQTKDQAEDTNTMRTKQLKIQVNNKKTAQIVRNNGNKDNPFPKSCPKIANNTIYVPCMNCKELISMDMIDKHSGVCTQSKEDHLTPIEEINKRIEKLMDLFIKLIDDLANSANGKISSAWEMIMNLLTRMYEIAHQMKEYNIEKGNSSYMFKQLMNEIALLNKFQPGSLGIKIHLERLFCLANVKLKLMKEIQLEKVAAKKPKEKKIQQEKYIPFTIQEETKQDDYQIRDSINQYQRQMNTKQSSNVRAALDADSSNKLNTKDLIEIKKQEMMTLKSQSSIFQQKVDDNLKEINKLMKISRSGSINNSIPIDGDNISQKSHGSYPHRSYRSETISDQSDSQMDNFDDTDFINNGQGTTEDEKQKLFYSKCLSILMKIEQNNLAQKIPISILYKEAMNRGVEITEWDSFINNAYNHCEDYLDVQRFRKGLKNNLKGVAKRLEELNKNQI